ncbi:MAG: hypothetical protein BWY74_02904 [Firmicutes bacterium ADurb.Bin419]|nr:MAG: hypothetical protein BWY74_02904 [Firmicutes bacterium ADurb.Bin419]
MGSQLLRVEIMTAGRPPKYKTAEEMQIKIDEYFVKKCADEVVLLGGKEIIKYNPPTINGLALYLGFMDRQSLYDYINRENKFNESDRKFTCTLRKAMARIEEYAEKQLHVGNSTGAIFWLKNRGWKDKHEEQEKGQKIVVNIPSIKIDGKEVNFTIGDEEADEK